ncbi:hypothetical protein V6N12_035361 [Hibiscus sabdariffa]|uniref:Uncharacterized protein n=1 Tax=Hibiscus sabdariffa TaxID=183260 RepID=A0ABR2BSP9_9ROSI
MPKAQNHLFTHAIFNYSTPSLSHTPTHFCLSQSHSRISRTHECDTLNPQIFKQIKFFTIIGWSRRAQNTDITDLATALSFSLSPLHLCPKIMSMIGENSDDLMRMSSSNESPKELEEELRKVGGAPDDEDWDKIASFLPFLQIFYETTLSFSGSRYVTGNTFVEEIYDIGYTINRSVDDLNDGVKNWIRASHDPIIIEENLLALENMEEEMQDLTLEQPTIIIDETNEVPE